MDKRVIISFSLIFSVHVNYGQLSDDFSDGEYYNNPEWFDPDSNFSVVNGALKLNAPPISDTAYISTTNEVGTNGIWEGLIRLNFNPSSSNFSRVYLMSDVSNLKLPLSGYFIQIGSATDDIALYRQVNNTITKLIDGRDGMLNSDTVKLRFSLTRDVYYEWNLSVDSAGGNNFVSLGTAIDSNFISSKYFGIYCKYTATRSDKFEFDDFEVSGTIYKDIDPPKILSSAIISENKWLLKFSEPLSISALNPANYSPVFFNGIIKTVAYDSSLNQVELLFEHGFPHGVRLSLVINTVEDLHGNMSAPDSLVAFYNYPHLYTDRTLVINELMIDPSPTVNLPDAEYIELYNPTELYINLQDWKVTDRKDTIELPDDVMNPQSYRTMVDYGKESLFEFINAHNLISGKPGLNNDTDSLYLLSPNGIIIDSVLYDDSWYSNSEGGRSIELINEKYVCNDTLNWQISTDDAGGTPGKSNSNLSTIPTYEPIDFSTFISVDDALVSFELTNVPSMLPNKNAIHFNPEISFEIFFNNGKQFGLYPSEIPEKNIVYRVEIDEITDCWKQQYALHSGPFYFPEKAEFNDVVINELLFNPKTGGSDYIEIFNRCDKVIDLSGWKIVNDKNDTNFIFDAYHPMVQNSYRTFTHSLQNVVMQFPSSQIENLYQFSLPSFDDDEGAAIILNEQNSLIDRFDYKESMHFALIKDEEGVSLERKSFIEATQNAHNWTSASSISGYGTPGYENSQRVHETVENRKFYPNPDIFSPDNDGYHDAVNFYYTLSQTENIGNISIYNANGKLVKTLSSNQLLSSSGFYSWDGTDDNLNPAPIGYYIAVFEYYNLEGKVTVDKATVVLAYKM